ncbi:hypothetical protein LTR95_003643 [Oleoguttula sp. CCFEE 5521]
MGDTTVTHDLDVLEIVFSCGICQATVSEVYASRESNKGFHSNSGDDDGVVTRMWIADCTHLFCSKHLLGGAAPFHRQDAQPEAPCPQCILGVHDDSPRKLYGIRGFHAGEHDPMIPKNWFKCPPVEIEASSTGMEAVRFQYVALARFAQKIHARCQVAQHLQAMTEAAHAGELEQRKHAEAEMQRMQREAALTRSTHEKDLAQLRKWQKRESLINHYLGIVPQMAEDLAQMRAQLADLGCLVSARDYQYRDDTHQENKAAAQLTAQQDVAEGGRFPSSSTTAVGDLPAIAHTHRHHPMNKGLTEPTDSKPLNGPGKQRTSSRDLMPPPFSKPTRRLVARDERRAPASRQPEPVQMLYDIPCVIHERPTHERAPAAFHAPAANRSSKHVSEHAAYTTQTQVGHRRYDEPMQITPAAQPSQSWDMRDSRAHRHLDPAASVRHNGGLFSRIRDHHSVHGTAAAQQTMQAREPRHVLSGEVPYARPPTTSPDAYATPQRPGGPPQSSVSSPFFHRSGVPSSATRMDARAPSRQSFFTSRQPMHDSRPEPEFDWRGRQQIHDNSHAVPPDVMSQISNSRSIQGPHPDSQYQQSNNSESWRPPGSHSRDVRAASHRSHMINTHQRPTASRSRITLPPLSSQASDMGLSRIRGVRSAFAQPLRYEHTQPRAGFQSSRGLFTANGRRSVRR